MAFRFVYWIILLSTGVLHAQTEGNQQSDDLAPNSIQQRKTGFTCRGKERGYYADTKTDCQIYHFCDEQGRQSTHDCPSDTLFNQRMLICDHWYMVDCSTSEANYAFNRLIGQKDKHFVSDSDVQLRTPRPDFSFDHPFPSSIFKSSSKKNDFHAPQNVIAEPDLSKNKKKQFEILETQETSNILPPQIDTNSIDPTLLPASEEFPQFDKSNERRNAYSGESSSEVKSRGFLPPPTGFQPPRVLPNSNTKFRQQEEQRLKNLGLPLQSPTQATRYQTKSSVAQTTKKPARTFDPDKNFKAFNHFFPSKKATHKDYDFSQYFTRKAGAVTTPSPATRKQFNNNAKSNNKNQFPTGPNGTQRPFVNNLFNKPSSTVASPQTTRRPVVQTVATTPRVPTSRLGQAASATKKPALVTRSPAFNQPQAPRASTNQIAQGQKKNVSPPANELLPPYETIKIYDDATTKGPPIYYEWRVPDEGLLPPRFDNETDTNSLKRSITEEGNFDNDFQSSETRRYGGGNQIRIQYKDLQKQFAIPEVELALESGGREGYNDDEAVNSFQVKIPYRKDASRASTGSDRYYYLEHAHCNPECHPYFFKPGRCEPCIKLKK